MIKLAIANINQANMLTLLRVYKTKLSSEGYYRYRLNGDTPGRKMEVSMKLKEEKIDEPRRLRAWLMMQIQEMRFQFHRGLEGKA